MMDYHALHGNNVASFDISQTRKILRFTFGLTLCTIDLTWPCPDRLPTIAASQVLDELQNDDTGYIPTGIAALDKRLDLDSSLTPIAGSERSGGIRRGAVTEIWGPPGSGRTALG